MPVFVALAAITMGWLLITGKIQFPQLPPVLLGLVALLFLGRGEWIGSAVGLGIAVVWFQGMRLQSKHSNEPKAIKSALALLDASPLDDAATIRARHRKLIADNHPDTGGSHQRAAQLNEARDLLLTKLSKPDPKGR
jgi:DnaJ family protein C protein 19